MAALHPQLLEHLAACGIDPVGGPASSEAWSELLGRLDVQFRRDTMERNAVRMVQVSATRELQDLYLHYQESQRIAGLGNWSYDTRTGHGVWSDECYRLFERDPVAGIPDFGVLLPRVHRADRRPLLARLRRALEAGADFDIELRYRLLDGGTRWLRLKGQPLCDTEGRSVRLRGTAMDISERKVVELRQAMEHTITRLVAEADAPGDVMVEIIRIIGETLGWVCGAEWRLDANKRSLHRCAHWSSDDPRVRAFYEGSRQVIRHPTTRGVLGRTLHAAEPIWNADVMADTHFQRADAARRAGLHATFAFPIQAGSELFGVIEFFHVKVQDPDPHMLRSAQFIGRLLGQFFQRRRAQDALRQSEIHFQHLAFHDTLTDLPNRAMFNRHLSHAIAQAERHGRGLAVLFIDLDRFKNVNDTLGHGAGDRLLQEMARRITAALRSGDIVALSAQETRDGAPDPQDGLVARLGGDEFVVLIEDVDVGDAAAVAQVARRLLGELVREFPLDGQLLHMTASIGIAVYPQDGTNEFTLMKHADIAMYRAKERGKNNFQFYSAHMDQYSAQLLALEASLRRALERGELRLHYQAKVQTGNGRIIGAEALLRWEHPSLGMVPPATFIPTAEETGLIVPLSQWVLREACRQGALWRAQGLPELPIAVNLSPRQFIDEDIVADTRAILAETGMNPNQLEFEITESMMMHNAERAVEILADLRGLGIHIAIDDFGMGYSSLSHLKQFPIDTLKIDRSFIGDIPGDRADMAITEAIIAIGKSLRIAVVAEGVETQEQLQFLRERNCDQIQGFLFSKPLPPEDFAAMLRDCEMAA